MNTMTLGTSTFLIAVGAIMRYAVSARGNGFDVAMVGAILMIVGIFGAVVTLAVFASSSSRRTAFTGTRGTVVVEEREVL
jgi:Zn-dependent membrane protease YugP